MDEPKGSKVEATVFQDLDIGKKGTIRRTIDDYGKKVVNQAPPTYDQVTNLRASLIDATHHMGQYCPAVHILNCSRFKQSGIENQEVNVIYEMPQTVPYDDKNLAPAKEIEVKTTPVAIPQLVTKKIGSDKEDGFNLACDNLFSSAANMDIDVQDVDIVTKGQSDNPEWHIQRRGAITATRFSAVMKVTSTEKVKSCSTFIKEILEPKPNTLKNVPAIKWGTKNESKAKEAFVKKVAKDHKDFHIEEHGLMVYSDCKFIRGSPDGIISCACHGQVLLEIKCPFNARMMTVKEGVQQGKIKYLDIVNGQIELKKNTPDGYYSQIQGLMGITGIKKCVFVIWTSRDMVTIDVDYNEEFFLNKLVPSCKDFFRKYLVPRLLLNMSTACTEIVMPEKDTVMAPTNIAQPLSEIKNPDFQPEKR